MAGKNEGQGFRDMANTFRKAADIMDKVADNLEDESIGRKEQEERQDTLLAEFMVQMMKIQKMEL